MTAVGHVLVTMRNGGVLDDTMARLTIALLREVYTEELDPVYYLRQLPEFLREEQRLIAAAALNNVLEPEAAAERFAHAIASSRITGSRARRASIEDDLPPPVEPIPTGFLSLDGPMLGGPGRRETIMICAGTGVGKTSFVLNLQRGHAVLGFRTGLWTLELPGDKIRQRRSSLCARISYNTVRRAGSLEEGPSREDVQVMVREGITAWTGADAMERMYDFDYSAEEASVEKIDQDLNDMVEAGEPLDVAIVDWLECLELPARREGQNKRQQVEFAQTHHLKELRHKIEYIAGKLTTLAVKYNVVLYVVTQTAFEVQNKSVVRMKDKAEAKGAARKMSYFWGMGMSPEDEQRGIVTITADKTRDSGFFQVQLRRRLEEQRFEDLEQQAEARAA